MLHAQNTYNSYNMSSCNKKRDAIITLLYEALKEIIFIFLHRKDYTYGGPRVILGPKWFITD